MEFECILGENLVKMIELENTSSKPVVYSVMYEGSEDFIIESGEKIRIEGNQIYSFKI